MIFQFVVDDREDELTAETAHELWRAVRNSHIYNNKPRSGVGLRPKGKRHLPTLTGVGTDLFFERWVKRCYWNSVEEHPRAEDLVAKALLSMAKGKVVKVDMLPNTETLGKRVKSFRPVNDGAAWEMQLENSTEWWGVSGEFCFYEDGVAKPTVIVSMTEYGYYKGVKVFDEKGNEVECVVRFD